jgi:hypothetical protein
VRMSSNVGLAGAKGEIAATFTGSLIKEIQIQQAIFPNMQISAGGLRWWKRPLPHAILKQLVMFWER